MMQKIVAAFAAADEEARVPAQCLAEMGIAPGTRMILEASPGRLLLTAFWDAPAVRSDLGAIARDLADLRGRLQRVARMLPEPAADPPAGMGEVGADLLGSLECILTDDLEPALAKLREAVEVTLGQV